MTVNVKFTKFDNTPWGFRLAGGSDFPHPLTVIKVAEGGLAECMGLKVGDVVVRLNDEPVSGLTHGQAHEALLRAGNNFVLGVKREEDPLKALEALNEENIVPYQIPLADLPPVFPEQILKEEAPIERPVEEEEQPRIQDEEEEKPLVEELPDKPRDADSEVVPNQNLTDDEIAQLILEEEELLSDQGVLGVNFKKLRPRVPVLKESKVLEELQHIATEEPPRVQELKHQSTFLQKPERPVPTPRKPEKEPVHQEEPEPYRVVIKKQQRRSVTDRLLERGLLKPSRTPEPPQAEVTTTPSATPEPGRRSDQDRETSSRADSRPESHQESRPESHQESRPESHQESRPESGLESREESRPDSKADHQEVERQETVQEPGTREQTVLGNIEREMASLASMVDREKIRELVSTEINLEKQLENVQSQLLALKQLPSEIENHLRIVSEQLKKIMELSGVQNGAGANGDKRREEERKAREYEEERHEEEHDEVTEEHEITEETEDLEYRSYSAFSDEPPRIAVTASEDEEEEDTETHELEGTLSVKSEEESRVKKFIVSYETKVLKSRDPSPATSRGSFSPDIKLSPKDQVIQELQRVQERRSRKRSQELWPQAKQLELTLGRRWRCPNDFFNDEMIAEVLSSQAEVIRGRALGVNFKKYEKTNLPNYDHLMNSSVYKMIHKMEREPRKGIPARPAKVNAAEDIIERARSPALSFADDRSVSH